jgi:ATP-dependent DNA ligase I
MLLADLAATSAAAAATPSRLAKVELIAACLRRAGPEEAAIAAAHLSGELRQRRLGVGWAGLREPPPPATEPSLGVTQVDAVLAAIERASGSGSRAQRRALLGDLLGRATAEEQRFLTALIAGELRQGAQAGVMAEAVAAAAGVPVAAVRRAAMLGGDLGAVAEAALRGGEAALARFRLEVGRPVQPMLAQPAPSLADALAGGEPRAIEWKVDGIRIQAHRSAAEVAIFTRTLDDITARVPELVAAVAVLPVTSVVLDGEAVALRADGRPRPFQETAGRAQSRDDVAALSRSVPLTPFLFDCLHLDGEDLIDRPLSARHAAATQRVPEHLWVPRLITAAPAEAAGFLADTLARGHEGVMVKDLQSPYAAGRRGAAWLKVKPAHTLDLAVLAAEWGHGRRRGWLSNLHLGARDPETGGFVMLGKTFKGLTDEMLAWQTRRLLELETSRDRWTVRVRPELVVEVAFDGVQASPRYPGQMALRFARVIRHRPDKPAAEADTVAAVRAVHAGSSAPGN